ncbi:folylpolyglutamate synthase [Podospora aff. communis PSN243]|uniref:Folylpolyglutamate synthase n=1 Tax=Podospora aff. communis PSN243 TaxID=3040156 RepID=A0AAV9G329_9PEZI|nr:folylpolyglutamate synthase [Podospora aff. communis PSN243]
MSRTYDAALHRLAQLQSNRAITSLFISPPPSSTSTPDKKPNLNALAIPEMLSWLARAGYTPSSLSTTPLRCVHIAGTKGKGSVTALVASILQQYPPAGPVGAYTSPHVLSVRERILLDGSPISRELFTRYFFEVWDRLSSAAREAGDTLPPGAEEGYDGPETKPFYFRFLTILAVHVFVSEGVRSAVVECGIGGEYDATNVLPKEIVTASVVTRLGVDHVAMLGGTVEEIAWHKSGVWKEGVKGFTGLDEREGVRRVLRDRAEEKGAVLVEVEGEEGWEGVEGARLQGPFQRENMGLAVAVAREHLGKLGVRFEGEFGREGYKLGEMPEEFKRGLREAALRGRCERLVGEDGVEWFVDGAHTEDSLAGVGQWFAGQTGEDDVRVLLFNQQERDPAVLMKALLDGAKDSSESSGFTHAIFSRNENEAPGKDEPARDLSVQEKARETFLASEGSVTTTIYDALQPALEEIKSFAAEAKKAGKTCKVLVTGSFHLVGAVLKKIDNVEY